MNRDVGPTTLSGIGKDHPAGPIEDDHRELRTRLETLTDNADHAGILSSLQELPKMLAKHFADEEEVGGLYDDLAERCPAVCKELELLRGEHRAILDDLEVLGREVQNSAESGEALSKTTREVVARCLETLRRHERAESTIIADVYYNDEGGRG